MLIGVNLSFAVKRWLDPEQLAQICKQDLGVDHVQFTWDLINPWWPQDKRQILAERYRQAFDRQGIRIDASFGGIAAYTYAQLLSPTQIEREISLQFFKRCVDLTAELGAKIIGTPVGGMDHKDAFDPIRRQQRYQDLIGYIKQLATYCKDRSIEEIQIEATPLITEFPHSPAVSNQLIDDLQAADVKVSLLIDWGHALYKPLLQEEADMEWWLQQCGHNVGAIHLQQTDGLLDRHWGFDQDGLVTAEKIRQVADRTGTHHIPQYVEFIPPFEASDQEVLDRMKKTMYYLQRHLSESEESK